MNARSNFRRSRPDSHINVHINARAHAHAHARTSVRARIRALAGAALAGVVLAASPAAALDADRERPAVLEADDFELDLETGVRTYRGGVVFRQGGVRLDCDELVTYHDHDEQLRKGVCTGNPGAFKRRRRGRDAEFSGRANSITYDRARGVVVLEGRAEVGRGQRRIQGPVITYDLATGKARVNAGSATPGDDRPRLTIEPRNQP